MLKYANILKDNNKIRYYFNLTLCIKKAIQCAKLKSRTFMNSDPDPINIYMNFEIPLKSGFRMVRLDIRHIFFQNENRKRNTLGIEILPYSEPLSADAAHTL